MLVGLCCCPAFAVRQAIKKPAPAKPYEGRPVSGNTPTLNGAAAQMIAFGELLFSEVGVLRHVRLQRGPDNTAHMRSVIRSDELQ
jgi:hypothetical protein